MLMLLRFHGKLLTAFFRITFWKQQFKFPADRIQNCAGMGFINLEKLSLIFIKYFYLKGVLKSL